MKRVLIISTDWSGLVTPIVNEMRCQGNEVDYIDHSILSNFKYYGFFNKFQSKVNNILTNYAYKKREQKKKLHVL